MKIFNKQNLIIVIIFVICGIFEFSMGALYGKNTIDPDKPRTCEVKVRIPQGDGSVEERTTDEVILSDKDIITEII